MSILRAIVLASTMLSVAGFEARAQYSTHATDSARQGIFIYRSNGQTSGNIAIQPRQMLTDRARQGIFIYRSNNQPSGNLAIQSRPSVGAQNFANNLSPQVAAAASGPGNANDSVLEGVGTIDHINPGTLQVTANGKTWIVKPDATATIEVVGTASLDFLRPDQLVKFHSSFDYFHAATAPLSQLSVISLRPGEKAGAMPDEAEHNTASDSDGTQLTANPKSSTPQVVIGRIKSIHGNQLIVGTGTDVYKAELNSDAQIDVRTADVSLAQPGDKIVVRGHAERPGMALANMIQITLAKPVTSKKSSNLR